MANGFSPSLDDLAQQEMAQQQQMQAWFNPRLRPPLPLNPYAGVAPTDPMRQYTSPESSLWPAEQFEPSPGQEAPNQGLYDIYQGLVRVPMNLDPAQVSPNVEQRPGDPNMMTQQWMDARDVRQMIRQNPPPPLDQVLQPSLWDLAQLQGYLGQQSTGAAPPGLSKFQTLNMTPATGLAGEAGLGTIEWGPEEEFMRSVFGSGQPRPDDPYKDSPPWPRGGPPTE